MRKRFASTVVGREAAVDGLAGSALGLQLALITSIGHEIGAFFVVADAPRTQLMGLHAWFGIHARMAKL